MGSLKALLKGAGFRKQGSRFHRRKGGTTQVLDLQLSQGNTATSARFYVNLGVKLDLLSEGPTDPSKLKQHECDWRVRLEEVTAAPDSWLVSSKTKVGQLCARLSTAVGSAVELLDTLDSPQALLESGQLDCGAWREASAQIRYALGDDAAALADLEYLERAFSERRGMSVLVLVERFGFRRLKKSRKES